MVFNFDQAHYYYFFLRKPSPLLHCHHWPRPQLHKSPSPPPSAIVFTTFDNHICLLWPLSLILLEQYSSSLAIISCHFPPHSGGQVYYQVNPTKSTFESTWVTSVSTQSSYDQSTRQVDLVKQKSHAPKKQKKDVKIHMILFSIFVCTNYHNTKNFFFSFLITPRVPCIVLYKYHHCNTIIDKSIQQQCILIW